MSAPLRIGVAGLGTVGVGTVKLLRQNKTILSERCGREIIVTAVSARDPAKDRGISLSDCTWHSDAETLATDENVDVVVELIGGSDGIAKDLVEAALANGKHVVTANKALVAHHGCALAVTAENARLVLAYEAAVAGGIPIIKALREGMSANAIDRVYGILNGTCNTSSPVCEKQVKNFRWSYPKHRSWVMRKQIQHLMLMGSMLHINSQFWQVWHLVVR